MKFWNSFNPISPMHKVPHITNESVTNVPLDTTSSVDFWLSLAFCIGFVIVFAIILVISAYMARERE